MYGSQIKERLRYFTSLFEMYKNFYIFWELKFICLILKYLFNGSLVLGVCGLDCLRETLYLGVVVWGFSYVFRLHYYPRSSNFPMTCEIRLW